MDIIGVKTGMCKGIDQPWDADEAKLVINFKEDHNVVRVRGVQYFVDIGKYQKNEYGVLEPVEGWVGTIEQVRVEDREENKPDSVRAEEARLIINYGESAEDVRSKGVQYYIDAGMYVRNKYGVLVRTEELEEEEVVIPEVLAEKQKDDVVVETPETEEDEEEDITEPIDEGEYTEMSIEQLQELYKERTGKNLSPRFMLNRQRIISKL